MKTLSLSILFIISIACSDNKATKIYLCDSENGKKYHYTSTCRGLSNCHHKIIEATLEAKKQGKTWCGWEK